MANAVQKQQQKTRYRPNQEILMERLQGLYYQTQGLYYQTLTTVLMDHNGFKSTSLRGHCSL